MGNPATGVTDIIVRFVGGSMSDVPSEAIDRLQLPPNYSTLQRKLQGITRGADKNRASQVQNVFDEIIRVKSSSQIGVLCIRGSSRGGIWSLELAEKLTANGVPIQFVSLQDAAFSTVDAINEPDSRFKWGMTNVPRFKAGQIVADIKLSHFQHIGNYAEFSISQNKLIWKGGSGDMDGEIHGEVVSFQSDLINVTGYQKDDDGLAHNACCGRAEVKDATTISEFLRKACT
jgi:hypothetical protein